MNGPRILLWDVEKAPAIAAIWGLFKQNIPHDHILQDSYIICAAWKWYGDDNVQSISVGRNYTDDRGLTKKLHSILSEADILVHQNGDKFDLKVFNTRAIKYGLKPVPPKPTVDTLKQARKHFRFISNKLDYIGRFLDAGAKMDTPKGLWIKAIKGNREAINLMVDYCKQDVLLLEEIYKKLLPFIQNHPNLNLYGNEEVCPNCGSKKIQKRGFRFTRSVMRRRYACMSCGAWHVGELVARAGIK